MEGKTQTFSLPPSTYVAPWTQGRRGWHFVQNLHCPLLRRRTRLRPDSTTKLFACLSSESTTTRPSKTGLSGSWAPRCSMEYEVHYVGASALDTGFLTPVVVVVVAAVVVV